MFKMNLLYTTFHPRFASCSEWYPETLWTINFIRPSTLGLGLCVLRRWCLSDNWYEVRLTSPRLPNNHQLPELTRWNICSPLLQLLLTPRRGCGRCRPERPSGCTRATTRPPCAALSTTELNRPLHKHAVWLCILYILSIAELFQHSYCNLRTSGC